MEGEGRTWVGGVRVDPFFSPQFNCQKAGSDYMLSNKSVRCE